MNLKFFANLSLKGKLLLGFSLLSLITLIVGFQGLKTISGTLETVEDLMSNDVELLLDSDELLTLGLSHRRYEKDFFLNIGKPDKQAGYVAKFQQTSSITKELLASARKQVNDDPHLPANLKSVIRDTVQAYEQYVVGFLQVAEQVRKDPSITPQEANKLMGPHKKAIYTFENGLQTLHEEAQAMTEKVVTEMKTEGSSSETFISVLVCIGVILGIILGFIITRMITKPMAEAVSFAGQVSRGDFSNAITHSRKDEIGALLDALNKMSSQLNETFQEISKGIVNLSDESSQLSNISDKMEEEAENTSGKSNSVSVAVEEMTTNLTAVAAAMEQSTTNTSMVAAATEEMSTTINEISDNADKAKTISAGAVEQAKNANISMTNLGKAANDISQVTETITEISEQTNLLALNATIEAARAGEAGKGFAVVANEIKELARQTADATRDIKVRIEDVQQTTDLTVSQIDAVSNVISEINGLINIMATAVEEQSNATSEITTNITQVSQGIQEVNENISQVTAVSQSITTDITGVSESARTITGSSSSVKLTSSQLASLAAELKDLISQFKI
ncbi:MAG: methyl-accepting chemotaxis protein [Desulfotalea sp.]